MTAASPGNGAAAAPAPSGNGVTPDTGRLESTARPSLRAGLLPALVVAAAAMLAYANAAPRAIVHDDAFFVPSRHTLAWPSIAQMFREDTWASSGAPVGTYRPVALLTIAVNGAMFGSDPVGYHATNVVLHALASVMVFLLVFQLVGAAATGLDAPRAAWCAALAAAVFAVHPIHTEAVDSVFNRSEVLATTGVVAALWILLRWSDERPVAAWAGAATLYFVALLCRESAVMLPLLAAAMLWFLHPGEAPRDRLRRVLPVAVLAIPLGEYFVLRQFALASSPQSSAPALGVDAAGDLASRFLYSLSALREYVRMMAWPWPLRMSYEDFAGDRLVAAAVVHATLVGGAIAARRRAPVVTFAVAFFYASLLPSTRLFTSAGISIPFTDIVVLKLQNSLLVGERVAYLPSVALAIVLGAGFLALATRRGLAAAAMVAALPIAAGAAVTHVRNAQWHSAPSLFAADVEAAPENGDGWRLYVSSLTSAGRIDEAARACDGQLEHPSRSAQLFNNCGVVYDKLGRDDAAIESYTRAIDLGLAAVGHANRGRVYARLGRMAEAEAEFVAAAEAESSPAQRHFRTGQMLARFHPERRDEARREFEAALAIQPDFGAAKQALANLPR